MPSILVMVGDSNLCTCVACNFPWCILYDLGKEMGASVVIPCLRGTLPFVINNTKLSLCVLVFAFCGYTYYCAVPERILSLDIITTRQIRVIQLNLTKAGLWQSNIRVIVIYIHNQCKTYSALALFVFFSSKPMYFIFLRNYVNSYTNL